MKDAKFKPISARNSDCSPSPPDSPFHDATNASDSEDLMESDADDVVLDLVR